MLIAIPSDTTDGLDSAVSEHFGHCAAFTLVTVADDTIGEVSVLENTGHEEGGCMTPVHLLMGEGVEVLLAGGMGGRPLAGFQQVGIDVRSREGAGTVREAVELSAAEGFGGRDESRVVEVPRAQLAADVSVGDTVFAQDQQGQRFRLVVLHMDDTMARLDANHPLAGKDLVFELTVKSVEGIKTSA